MANENMALIGRILQRASVLGDAELAGLLGELMTTMSTEAGAGTATAQAADSGIAPAGKKYVVCVEATLPNGQKVQHPLIGAGYAMPNDIEDIHMTTGTVRSDLERANSGIASTLRSMYGVTVTYILVTDEVIADLEERLHALLRNLEEAIEKAVDAKADAYHLMNVSVDEDLISDDMLRDIISKTLYAGSAVDASGRIVEREDGVKYDEEQRIEESDGDEDADEEDDYDDGYDEEEDE